MTNKTYEVHVDWSGYSRGFSTDIVEADSEEDAIERFWDGYEDHEETVRDDREREGTSAKLKEIK